MEEKSIFVQGPAGMIEAAISLPKATEVLRGTAIICHPHPLHGGTMNNKVVTILVRALNDLGFAAVRFNFRGVGQSAGTYDEGRGELLDLYAVADWVTKHLPKPNPLWLAGFSFGGWIAAKGALHLPVAQLITVAPMVSRLALEDLSALTCPWLLVQGEADEITPPDAVYAFVKTLVHPPQVLRIPEASHFFHGKLMEFREKLVAQFQEK